MRRNDQVLLNRSHSGPTMLAQRQIRVFIQKEVQKSNDEVLTSFAKEVQKSTDQFLSNFAKSRNRFQPGTKRYKKVLINFTQVLLKAEIDFSQEQISTEKYRSISLKFCYSEQKQISARKKEVQKTTDQYISSFFKEAEINFNQEQSILSKSGQQYYR